MVLLDEPESTDPAEGSALSRAIITAFPCKINDGDWLRQRTLAI